MIFSSGQGVDLVFELRGYQGVEFESEKLPILIKFSNLV